MKWLQLTKKDMELPNINQDTVIDKNLFTKLTVNFKHIGKVEHQEELVRIKAVSYTHLMYYLQVINNKV